MLHAHVIINNVKNLSLKKYAFWLIAVAIRKMSSPLSEIGGVFDRAVMSALNQSAISRYMGRILHIPGLTTCVYMGFQCVINITLLWCSVG